jgi:hypothetical protein
MENRSGSGDNPGGEGYARMRKMSRVNSSLKSDTIDWILCTDFWIGKYRGNAWLGKKDGIFVRLWEKGSVEFMGFEICVWGRFFGFLDWGSMENGWMRKRVLFL